MKRIRKKAMLRTPSRQVAKEQHEISFSFYFEMGAPNQRGVEGGEL